MKIVIIGSGKVGRNLSSLLVGEGHDVTVIDQDPEAIKRIQDSLDVMCVEGNGATTSVQLEAGVNKAEILVATTPNDETNMLCCLIAKKLGAKKTISRVRDPEYYGQIDLIREDLGLSMIINPERMAADEIFRVLVFSSASKVEVFAKGRIELVEYVIPENSVLCGLNLAQIYNKTKIQLLISAVQRGNETFIPSGLFTLQAGDRVSVVSTHKDLEKFFRITGSYKEKIKTVMIVGGGKIAFYLAKQLTDLGMRVKIIDNDMERCTEIVENLDKVTVIHGDGADHDLLLEEGLADADAFVALTGTDEVNIIMALYAKNNSHAKSVAKINRESYVELTSKLGLDSVISPKYITTNNIISYVRSLDNDTSNNIEALYHIVGDKVEAIEFKVSERIPDLVGVPLKSLTLKDNILICAIIRKRTVIIPSGNDTIEEGDSVVVVTKDYHFSDIKDILE